MSVKIGKIHIGDNYPLVVQSMTNTDTNDVEATLEQCIRIARAGGKLVRITVQNLQEVESLRKIREQLNILGYDFPLVADVHFNPKIAEESAKIVEKVRINPGNYTGRILSKDTDLSDQEFQNGLIVIREKLKPLLKICKERGTALRIGVNHGSLSERIMNRYGDTPEGMAESAMDFVRMCHEENFTNLLISMKASNVRIMVYASRLLDAKMKDEGMPFPLHLGVTEAGSGLEGRIRSAVGIAALLQEGIGDTIRVSLTEDPENEIPVALEIAKYFSRKKSKLSPQRISKKLVTSFHKRNTFSLINIGGNNPPVVISDLKDFLREDHTKASKALQIPDFIYCDEVPSPNIYPDRSFIVPLNKWRNNERPKLYPSGNFDDCENYYSDASGPFFLFIKPPDICPQDIELIKRNREIVLIADCISTPDSAILTNFFSLIEKYIPTVPVIIKKSFNLSNPEQLMIRSAGETGLFFLDGLADGIWLKNNGVDLPLVKYSFEILQASRARISSTEYISCPSCGRTRFDIQKVIREIKENTSHLAGLKIAVMGCIVNGPGEMADADYGYIGAGPGNICLYRGKTPIMKNLPEHEAIHHLINLIKQDGKWVDP